MECAGAELSYLVGYWSFEEDCGRVGAWYGRVGGAENSAGDDLLDSFDVLFNCFQVYG